jgi:hypothetical protein
MTTITPLTLEAVEQEFLDWRAVKKGGEKIPERLWEQIRILLKHYKRSLVLKRLGVTIQQAREQGMVLSAPKSIITKKSVAPFIEIPLSGILPKPSAHTPMVTLKRGELVLSLEHPTEAQLHLLINTVVK